MVKKIIHWLLFAVVIIYVVSGFGITEYQIVEFLTFGLLTKPLAFQIHNILTIPFLLLLVSHVCLALFARSNKRVD